MKTLILTPIIILLAIGCKKIDKKVEIIPNPKIEEKTPKAKALSYAIETKELLGKNLQEKMKQGGAENALEFFHNDYSSHNHCHSCYSSDTYRLMWCTHNLVMFHNHRGK